MKRLIIYSTSLLTLILVLLLLNKRFENPQDLYQLSSSIYLEKVDYFSHYRLLSKGNDEYETVNNSITEIGKISKLYICHSGSTNEYFVISKNNSIQKFDDIESLKTLYDITGLKLLSPWQFIEKYKKHDSIKTIREILIIAIVLVIALLFRDIIVKLRTK